MRDTLQITLGRRSLERVNTAPYTEHISWRGIRSVCPTRLYIADEHASVRSALAERLERDASLTVIGQSGDAEQMIREIRKEKPDVVLVEVKRSDGLGLEILRQISNLPGSPCLIVLTSYASEWEEEAANRAGAVAYLLKDIATGELIHHITQLIDR
jgi:two-component system response regulator DevR